MHDTCNMVDMKCRLHNQAYVNLVHKGYTLPKQIVIDQFVQEKVTIDTYKAFLKSFGVSHLRPRPKTNTWQ